MGNEWSAFLKEVPDILRVGITGFAFFCLLFGLLSIRRGGNQPQTRSFLGFSVVILGLILVEPFLRQFLIGGAEKHVRECVAKIVHMDIDELDHPIRSKVEGVAQKYTEYGKTFDPKYNDNRQVRKPEAESIKQETLVLIGRAKANLLLC